MRLTRKVMEKMFADFCNNSNLKIAESYNDVGGYQLDYAPIYGGYCINQIANTSGGVHRITTRYSAKEMAAFFDMVGRMGLKREKGRCKDCKYYEKSTVGEYFNPGSNNYDCKFFDNDFLPNNGVEVEYEALDDTGLETWLNIGPEFGCIHFESK